MLRASFASGSRVTDSDKRRQDQTGLIMMRDSRKLDQLDSVERLTELKIPPGNRLEALVGRRRGQHSIRINEQYRICFSRTDEGPDAVEIVDYHG